MISYEIYKLLHFLGIFTLLVALGGLLLQRQGGNMTPGWRRQAMISHGVGLFLTLLGGFGMLARLGLVAGLPGWVYGKLLIWLILGGLVALIKRRPELTKGLWWGCIALAVAAAYLGINKPF